MKLEISGLICKKFSDINFHYNASIASRLVPCGQTDMTKLLFAFSQLCSYELVLKRLSHSFNVTILQFYVCQLKCILEYQYFKHALVNAVMNLRVP